MADTRDFLLEEIKHLLQDVDEFLTGTLKKEKLKKDVGSKRDELSQEIASVIRRVDNVLPKDSQEEYADVEIENSHDAPPIEEDGELYEDTAIPDSPNKNVMSQGSNHDTPEEPEPPEASEKDENGEPYGDMKIGPIAATDLVKPAMEGYLDKRRKEGQIGLQQWQRRYCVIKENIFYYFKNRNDKQQKNVILLNGYEARPNPDYDKKHKKRDFLFEVICPAKRSFQFIASSSEEMRAWIDAIAFASTVVPAVEAVAHSPVTKEPIDDQQIAADDYDETYDDVDTYQKSNIRTAPEEQAQSVDSGELYDDTGVENAEGEIMEEVYEDVSSGQEPEMIHRPPRHGALPEIPQPHIPQQPTTELPPVPRPELPKRPSNEKPAPLPRSSEDKTARAKTDKLPQTPTLPNKPEPWEDDYENIYMGMWDCSADDEDELGFKRGELVHIISREYDSYNWWVGEKNSKIGLVPKAYLMMAYSIPA